MSTPEAKVKAELKQYLRDQGAYFFMPVQTGYGAATLDFLVCLDGKFYGFETKTVGKKLTPRQELVSQQIRAAGGTTYKVTLVNGALEFETCGLTRKEAS
jgi:hypothetical protein